MIEMQPYVPPPLQIPSWEKKPKQNHIGIEIPHPPVPEVQGVKIRAYKRRYRLMQIHEMSTCFYCCSEIGYGDNSTLEHLVPRAHGGTRTLTNSVLACKLCNSQIGCRSFSEKMTTCKNTQYLKTMLDVWSKNQNHLERQIARWLQKTPHLR